MGRLSISPLLRCPTCAEKSAMLHYRVLLSLLLALSVVASAESHSGHYHDANGDGTDEHDATYDQQQFLGKDTAKQFAQYDTDVSVEKLTQLIKDKIDSDGDGQVSENEMLEHLQKVHIQQQTDDLDAHWKELNLTDDKLAWAKHSKTLQPNFFEGRTDPVAAAAAVALEEAGKGADVSSTAFPEKGAEDERELLLEFFKDLVRQHKRWAVADVDKDGALSREEYRSLLFPEDVPAMRDVLLSETMDQLDRDGDGRLSSSEYLAGQWTPSYPEEKEPHWLEDERRSFAKKDVSGDGYLDRAEVQAWVQPDGAPPGHALKEETVHLIREADDNKDGRLSIEEIVKHRDLFAGSRATRYGEDVTEAGHDEL